jgi:hypothetical protein
MRTQVSEGARAPRMSIDPDPYSIQCVNRSRSIQHTVCQSIQIHTAYSVSIDPDPSSIQCVNRSRSIQHTVCQSIQIHPAYSVSIDPDPSSIQCVNRSRSIHYAFADNMFLSLVSLERLHPTTRAAASSRPLRQGW